MTKTKYYDLQMDDSQDNYDVEVVNANLKKIDEQMKTRENATDALQEPEFTVADKRENIASKEKMPKILGKIAKWFSDLKTVAFSGSYNDLSDKPIVDANISSTSTNPVQNKVVKNALDHKLNGYTVTYTVPANTGGWHKIAQISDYFNFDLYTNGGWFSACKSMAHFQIQNIHGKIRIVQLSGKVLPNANNGIAKIRMVRVSDDVDTWILEEYSPSSINPEVYTFTMAGSLKLTPLDGSVDSTTSFKDSVVLDVLDIPTGHVITTGAVDNTMSDTSEHPVQNKVIKAYVDKKASENVDFSTSTSKLLNDSIEAPMLVTNATRNLFDARILNTTPTSVNSNTKYSVSEGSITVSAVSKNTAFVQVYWRAPIEKFGLSVGDKVFFSIEIDTSGANINGEQRVYLYQTSNENDGSKKVILSPGKEQGKLDVIDDTDIVLLFRLNQNTDYNEVGQFFTVKNIQIEKSSAVTNYVPYDGYEIKSCGKNLLDPNAAGTYDSPHSENGVTFTKNNDGSWTINGTATANVGVSIGYPGGDYTLIELEADAKAFLYGPSGLSGVSYGFYSNEGKQVLNDGIIPKGTKVRNLWISADIGSTLNNVKVFGVISYDLNLTNTMYVPYKESTVQITPSAEFPLLGLKSFDGETNIISPGNVEVTYAKSDSGAAIVDTLKKSVSDGKTKVANAITDKGVETATDATFDVMAENISKIDTELHGATLAVSTSDHELFGKTVTLDMHHTIVGTTVFSNNGTCSFIVQRSGPYTITCGEAHKDVSVTNIDVLNKTTISVNLLLLKIVTFASGTDEEIAKMIQAHYNNKINIADYWAVGDTRTVSLSAMAATTVGESHRAQTVQFVIADFEHDTLASGIGPHSKAAITLLQKDCLMDAANASNPVNGRHNTENGYMRGSSTNVGGWDSCARRGWCNDTYFKALPATWRSMVKEVIKYTGKGGAALSGTQSTSDKIFLPSPIELSGSTDGGVDGEGTQYQYYKNARANRYKMPKWDASNSRYLSSVYMTRSPKASNTYEYCYVWADGTLIPQGPANNAGIAPMLCI